MGHRTDAVGKPEPFRTRQFGCRCMTTSPQKQVPSARTEASTGFLHRLESLRGIAALMVAGWHSSAVLVATGWSVGILAFLRVFFNGHAAVTLFFVLSGLVLGGSLSR